jgi:hypothetical protein
MVTFGDDPDLSVWEKSVTPAGVDNGDHIDTTTSHNTSRRTKWPRQLVENTDISMRVAYAGEVRTEIEALCGTNDEITITYPDGTTDAFWGYLRSFAPQEATDGGQPEADIVIVITNTDAAFGEQAPVLAAVTGS